MNIPASPVNTPARIFIGTSNVVLPGAKNTFPVQFQTLSRLAYYSFLFNSVEINSTFYKTPLHKTTERWRHETQPSFRFTVKLSKVVTHQKGLAFNKSDIDDFMRTMSGTGSKKGCLLVQFPASITEDYFEKVVAILKRIRRNNRNNDWQTVVEFRHDSWYEPHVYRMLSKHQAQLVIHDKRGSRTPQSAPVTSVVYLRLHGPNGDYRGTYGQETLTDYSLKIKRWVKHGKTVYVYFNNTMGSAFSDARLLQSLVNGSQDEESSKCVE
jgi:uncharacterized protein YecE (DUF72 family)